jgi:hypothetical protein
MDPISSSSSRVFSATASSATMAFFLATYFSAERVPFFVFWRAPRRL